MGGFFANELKISPNGGSLMRKGFDVADILFMHDDGYGVQTLIGAEDKAGGFQGYRPYWQAEGWPDNCGVDRRFWTVWERVDGSPEIWPAVVDDFGSLRSGRMVRAIAQERK